MFHFCEIKGQGIPLKRKFMAIIKKKKPVRMPAHSLFRFLKVNTKTVNFDEIYDDKSLLNIRIHKILRIVASTMNSFRY